MTRKGSVGWMCVRRKVPVILVAMLIFATSFSVVNGNDSLTFSGGLEFKQTVPLTVKVIFIERSPKLMRPLLEGSSLKASSHTS